MIYKIPFCFLILTLLSLTAFGQMAPPLQPGGWIDGWDNYDNSITPGLGSRTVNWDFTGLRNIDDAPPAYEHPRIYFDADGLPDLRNRMANTLSGQAMTKQLQAFTALLYLGQSGYNQNATYARNADWNKWIDNSGKWDQSTYYLGLRDGNTNVWNTLTSESAIKGQKMETATEMAFLAFDCLIHKDQTHPILNRPYNELAAELATAMANWATAALNDNDYPLNSDNYTHVGGIHMALCYDLNYNMMTTAQQDVVRQALAAITPSQPLHGAYLDAPAVTSNWCALNSFEIITNLAIEGETGYQPTLTERWFRAYHTFINYGFYESGAPMEGLGKNYMFVTTAIAMARRGYSMLGHPHMRDYGTKYLMAIMQPFGYGFTSYDVWGGSGEDPVTGEYKFHSSDVVGLKYIFPDDPKIDFVWRNYISGYHKFQTISQEKYLYPQIQPGGTYYNNLITAAIFCQDFDDGDWQTQADSLVEKDYFASDRGLAVMKNGTNADDLAVQFHCRQDFGGHTHADRNGFTLSALGRVWIRQTYGGSPFQPTYFHTGIMVDGLGMAVDDPDGDKCRKPGKVLHYEASDSITQIAGDATYAYNWTWNWTGVIPATQDHYWLGNSEGWTKVEETLNDFQYIPKTEPHFDVQIYDYPSWYSPNNIEHMIKKPYNPIEKAYRTLGLIRGDCPFVLVVDDFKKDDSPHVYEWLAQIARDLTIESTDVNLVNSDYRNDIILAEPATEGNRRLLVRVLQNEGFTGVPGYRADADFTNVITGQPFNPNPSGERPRLIVESNSVEPKYKILLYPYMNGDPLPHTSWNSTKDTLTVTTCNSITKQIFFLESPTERTQFGLVSTIVDPPCNPTTDIFAVGNTLTTGGADGWKSNMVINESSTYTNTLGNTITVNIDKFNFNAHQIGNPVTPFVVKVNGDNDFTVLRIGTSRTSAEYAVGQNAFDFKTGGASIPLNDGETIAVGFLDAYADGTGGGILSVISHQGGGDEIWYSGHSTTQSGSVSEGNPPVQAASLLTTLTRTYHFNIGFSIIEDCCPAHLEILGNVPTGTYISGQTIYSNGVIAPASNVIFNTGDNILLDAGFEVPEGVEFETVIEGCNDGINQ